MIAANLHHRAKRPELLAILGIVGVVAFVGTTVARRFLSRARSTPEVRRTAVAAGTASPLVGHEFRLSGDRFRILESARQTDDGSLRGDYFAPPGAKVPEHVHLGQEESFKVVSGTLGVSVGGRELTLSPGQSAVGPPDVPHKWWNSGDEEVHFLVGLRPALHMETVFETWFGLARDGKTIRWLPKNPLQLAVLADEVGGWFYYTGVPKPVWKALFAPVALLAVIGRLLGYRARYPEYSGPEAALVRLFKLSTEIRRPPDEVFAFVADLRNDLYWGQRVVKEVRQNSEGPLDVGTRFLQIGHFLGLQFEILIEVTDYESNRKLGFEAIIGPLRGTGLRSVESVAGGTLLTITVESYPGGFSRVALPIFSYWAEREVRTGLAILRDLLEFRA